MFLSTLPAKETERKEHKAMENVRLFATKKAMLAYMEKLETNHKNAFYMTYTKAGRNFALIWDFEA